jgi:hypothetical protein
MYNLETVVPICKSSRVLVMNEYFNWKLHDFPENGVLLILRCMSCNIYTVCERYRFCFLNFFSDINSPPLFKNLPQTVSVLEGMTIGSTVYQLQVDDKDLTDSHLFFVSYSPSEGAVYFDVNKTSMLLLYYWHGFTYLIGNILACG